MPKEPDGIVKISQQQSITYEVRIYVGSRERYSGKSFTKDDVIKVVKSMQRDYAADIGPDEPCIPVRITATEFVAEDYREEGWEIAIINYPRRVRDHKVLLDFGLWLGGRLCGKLNQNRVSVVDPKTTTMFQSPDAEEAHK